MHAPSQELGLGLELGFGSDSTFGLCAGAVNVASRVKAGMRDSGGGGGLCYCRV